MRHKQTRPATHISSTTDSSISSPSNAMFCNLLASASSASSAPPLSLSLPLPLPLPSPLSCLRPPLLSCHQPPVHYPHVYSRIYSSSPTDSPTIDVVVTARHHLLLLLLLLVAPSSSSLSSLCRRRYWSEPEPTTHPITHVRLDEFFDDVLFAHVSHAETLSVAGVYLRIRVERPHAFERGPIHVFLRLC